MLVAFHGDKTIKAKYLARVRAHRAADELIQGTGWVLGHGCAIGCTLDAYDHARYPIELGIPEHLARLEDRIFESLPAREAMAWPTKFLVAIPVGADLSMVWPRFALWLLRGLSLKRCTTRTLVSIDRVIMLYKRKIAGDEPTASEWSFSADQAFIDSTIAGSWTNAVTSAAYAAYAVRYFCSGWVDDTTHAAACCASTAGTPNVTYWRSCAAELLRLLRAAKRPS